MAATLQAMVADRPVTVRELSVTEVRNWVAEQEGGAQGDPIRAFVFEDCSLDDLARMCGMPAAAMEAYGPSDLADLHEKCRALNPHFFRVREALISVSRAIQSGLDSLSSTVPSSP